MGVRRRLSATAAAVALGGALLAGCKQKPEPERAPTPPADHLSPGEAAEGALKAFGVPLPRQSSIVTTLQSRALVRTALTPEELASFVRARVEGGAVTAGSASTDLHGVSPKADAKRKLDITIRTTLDPTWRSEMVVQDVPVVDLPEGASDEERWRRAGFTGDGKLVDPARMQ